VLTASVVVALINKFHFSRIVRLFLDYLIIIGPALSVLFIILFSFRLNILPVVIGSESKSSFILRNISNQQTIQYIQENLPEEARVLMMWEGRGYYCGERCLPIADQSKWTWLATSHSEIKSLNDAVRDNGATHLLFSLDDAKYYAARDFSGKHYEALEFFLNEYKPKCTKQIFRDRNYHLYELVCP
jgi:hypothetical protein